MLDFLYFAGEVLCLMGLAYGAFLTLRNSETFTALGPPWLGRRRKVAEEQDPHVSSLGYWP